MAKLIVFSGAGLSAESGLATFRNAPDALWQNHSIDVVCNYTTWRKNYDLVHGFYNMRREQLSRVAPNSAHRMIAAWQRRYETVLLTQNVDDLLERAGCTDVIHLHGFLPEMTCELCGHLWHVGYAPWAAQDVCPQCSKRLGVKPAVTFFYQDAPRYRDLSRVLNSLTADDVFLVTGTSSTVIAIDQMLRGRPGYKIFNSLDEADIPHIFNENLLVPATQAFPLIDAVLNTILARPAI